MTPKVRNIGLILIGAGALIVLGNSDFFGVLPSFIWVCALFMGGAIFWLGSHQRLALWQRIAGFAFIAVFAMSSSGEFAGTAALGFPAMAFGLMYLMNPRRWWTILPGGILASLALFVTAETLFRWNATPVLFLGFAATFTLLYLLPPYRGGQRWALYPAIFWIILTVAVNDPGHSAPGWLLPFFLIGGGTLLLWWWQKNNS